LTKLRELDIANIDSIKKFIASLNTRANFSLQDLHDLLSMLVEAEDKACVGLSLAFLDPGKILVAAQPLFDKLHPSVLDMLPVINMFHDEGSQVDLSGGNAKHGTRYVEFMDKWSSWLQHHTAVSKYLDPHHVFMQNAATVVDPGLAAILAAFPAAVAPAAHATLVQFFTLPTAADAHATATALRTHYAGVAGGGAGAAHHLVHVTTTAGGLVFY